MTQAPAFGAFAPGPFAAAALRFTRRLPANTLGRRLASPVKTAVLASLAGQPTDVVTFGAKTRLHPGDNLTDKRALVTPQLFDPAERAALAAVVREDFHFIDAGANTGLYSLFIAALAGPNARIVAIEPQPVIKERLIFNITANDWGKRITHVDVALAEGAGTAELVVRPVNRGSSGLARAHGGGGGTIAVPTQSLLAIMDAHGMGCADALKIDIEGAEDRVIPGFLRDCPVERLPKLIIMETLSKDWRADCVALALAAGYREQTRTRRNIILARD